MSFVDLFYGLFALFVLGYWPFWVALVIFIVGMWWLYRAFNPKETL